jgi:hypothetical protein
MSRMDPFTVLRYAPQTKAEVVRTTRVRKHGGRTPKWRDRFTMPINRKSQTLNVECFDKERIGNDKFIGATSVDLVPAMMGQNTTVAGWYTLSERRNKKPYNGEIYIEVTFDPRRERKGIIPAFWRGCKWICGLGPKMWDAMKDNHPWLSCIFVDPDDSFTRPQVRAAPSSTPMGLLGLCCRGRGGLTRRPLAAAALDGADVRDLRDADARCHVPREPEVSARG